MALKVRLRAGERLAINGAVIRNTGSRTAEIEVLNEATLLQERDIILPEQADTPVKTLYFLIQQMHLEPHRYEEHYRSFIQLSSDTFASAFGAGDKETGNVVMELVGLIGERNHIAALRRLQKMFGRPGDNRIAASGHDRAQAGANEPG